MKILATSPIRNSAYCLPEYLRALQSNLEKHRHGYYFVTNDNNDDTKEILIEFSKHNNAVVDVYDLKETNDRRHEWTRDQLSRLGVLRDKCLKHGIDNGYDYVLMVDSDVVLQNGTVDRLIELSNNEHVSSVLTVATWDRHAPTVNYNVKIDKSDNVTGIRVNITDIPKKSHKSVAIVYMVWMIPIGIIKNGYASFESKDGEMEFKHFSKTLRSNYIEQIIDFTLPALHIEESGWCVVKQN